MFWQRANRQAGMTISHTAAPINEARCGRRRRARGDMLRGRAKVIFVLSLPAMFSLAACDEENPKNVLKEAIDVQGSCSEDHVGQRDDYAGQIVRWQMADTGKSFRYGFLFKKGNLND